MRGAASRDSVGAEQGRRGEVVDHDVPAEDGIRLGADALREEAGEVALARRAQAPDRGEVLLGVELQPLGR